MKDILAKLDELSASTNKKMLSEGIKMPTKHAIGTPEVNRSTSSTATQENIPTVGQWVKACKRVNPNVVITGDKIFATAIADGRFVIGAWDGQTGSIDPQGISENKELAEGELLGTLKDKVGPFAWYSKDGEDTIFKNDSPVFSGTSSDASSRFNAVKSKLSALQKTRMGQVTETDEIERVTSEPTDWPVWAGLADWSVWAVLVRNNYYDGKYSTIGQRPYLVVAENPEKARQLVIDNADYVLKDLMSKKLASGKQVLPRKTALSITDDRVCNVNSVKPSSMSTSGFRRMLTPNGVMDLKISDGKVIADREDTNVMDVVEGILSPKDKSNFIVLKSHRGNYVVTPKGISAGTRQYTPVDEKTAKEYLAAGAELKENQTNEDKAVPTKLASAKLKQYQAALSNALRVIDNIVQDGGRVGVTDPLSVKVRHHRKMIEKLKKESRMAESKNTKLTTVVLESQSFRVSDPHLAKVLRHFPKEVSGFLMGDELDDHLYNALYDFYFDEMPYGTRKARDGDPYSWISDKLGEVLNSDGFSIHPADYDTSEREAEMAVPEAIEPEIDESLSQEQLRAAQLRSSQRMSGVDPLKAAPKKATPFDTNTKISRGHEMAWREEHGATGLGEDENQIDGHDQMCVYCGKNVPPGVEPSTFKCCGEVGHTVGIPDGDELDEALTPDQMRAAQMRSSERQQGIRDEKISAFTSSAEKERRAAIAAGAGLSNRDAENTFSNRVGEALDEDDMNEAFLVEENEDLITSVLEDMGLDHGLDFFFDRGLIAIGKSTARVIVNALKNDPRIKGEPKIIRIDGEEVQISFDSVTATAPTKDLDVEDIPAADFDPDAPNMLHHESIEEGTTGELDALMRELAWGNGKDIYAVMDSPQGPVEIAAAEILRAMYDDISIDSNLNPDDDDFEHIEDRIADRLQDDYPMQEGVMESEEPGQESLDKSKYDVTTDMHGTTTYWLNGKRHRDDDQPAVIKADGSEYWYRNGKIHRDNKQPAVIKADGTKYWYTDGNYIGSLIPMQEGVMESAAPGQEAWVKKNKQNFINQYGQKKGLEVLYATSWDRSKKNEDVNEDVSMNITAQGEDDVVSIIRKLSGLDNSTVAPDMQPVVAVNEPVAPQFSTMSDLVSTLDQIDASPGDDDGENEIEVIPAAEFDTEPEVEESEYANEPDPTVHTSTTAMINQGNDLNRPKRSYSDRPYRGDNPMAETRDLLKQYASMRKDISK